MVKGKKAYRNCLPCATNRRCRTPSRWHLAGMAGREAGESLVERRWQRASRCMLGSHGLLWCSNWASTENTGARRCGWELRKSPGLHDAGPRVDPGRHGRAAGSTGGSARCLASRGGASTRVLLLALAWPIVPAAGGVGGWRRGRRTRAGGRSSGRRPGRSGRGEECGGCRPLRAICGPDLFLKKEGARLRERHGRPGR